VVAQFKDTCFAYGFEHLRKKGYSISHGLYDNIHHRPINTFGDFNIILDVAGKSYKLKRKRKKWYIQYRDVVWTNKEPFKKQPRLCLNCGGKYISPL
jgi:hypothetical protein